MDKLRKNVTSAFRLSGYAVQSEAATYLCGILEPIPDNQKIMWLDRIIDKVQKMPLANTLIKKEIVEQAVKECGKGENHEPTDVLEFINAFDFPKLDFDKARNKFIPSTTSSTVITDASNKPQLFMNRYNVLLQRTLHHELFSPQVAGMEFENDKKKFDLKVIEFLAGCTSKVGDVIVLGMITQLKEGKYYLEDPTGAVQMDLSAAKFHTGLFTENCFVLAEGSYDDGLFSVNAIGLPPPEETAVTRSYYGNVNFFGSKSTLNKDRLLQLEGEDDGAMIIFLAEVHMDNKSVRDKLKALFEGYNDSPPVAFVLMGNFLTQPHGVQSCISLRKAFQDLADIIVEFPNLASNSKFVIIPGPGDPGFVNIVPRPPLQEVMVDYLKEKVPGAVFMSNPCRIRYCTKEILIFREDVMAKMCRNSIYFPTTGNIPTHFVKTLIGQAHLCPLPLHVRPIYWGFDHSMFLYPLPDLIVMGDKCDPFTEEQQGAIFINPGSFVKTEFSFKTYTPCDNKIEDCQLPGES